MPEIIKLQHTPDNRSVCEPVVTQKEWLEILNDSMVKGYKKQIENLLLFYRRKGHKATCYDIGKEYSRPYEGVSRLVTNFNTYAKKYLGNRFTILDGEEEKLWPISMLGKVVAKDRFEWTVRPELCAAIRQYLLHSIYNRYRELILAEGLDNSNSDERYKWEILTSCSGKTTEEIIRILFRSNLVDARYEGATVNELLKTHLSELCEAFDILREDAPFDELFSKFKPAAKALTPEGKTSFGTIRTAVAFLSALNPQEYTPFTTTLYESYCKYIGEEFCSNDHKYLHFLELLKELVKIECGDTELVDKIKSETEGLIYSDMLNAQDILWQMSHFFKKDMPKSWLQEMYDECLENDPIFKDGGWFSGYEPTVKWLRSSILDSKDASECVNILPKLIYQQKNGIANVGWNGKFNNSDQPLIEGAWPEIYPILKQCIIDEEITTDAEKKVREIINGLATKRKHPTAINRIWSGLFPNYLSTTADPSMFSGIYDYLHKNLGLEKPTGSWLKDNIAIIQFLNKRVEFQHPWHSSLFVWYIKNCINTSENNTNNMDKYIKLLKANHNLVLTGAPGTGKTHLAQDIAEAMGATKEDGSMKMVQFHPSYDYTDFVEGLRPKVDGDGFERVDGVFKKFCADAISSVKTGNFEDAYEKLISDLMEMDTPLQLKTPNGGDFAISVNSRHSLNLHTGSELKINGTLTKNNLESQLGGSNVFKWWQGYFKGVENLLIDKYGLILNEKPTSGNYIFIIDEINRGELSKIFGELFFSIDPGYRGTKGRVETQYQNMVEAGDPFEKGFYVPENVYIIGTMNDIDRSVESMDFAIRRRFAWYEVSALERVSMLDEKIPDLAEEAKASMNALNEAIEKVDLSPAYHIGPAYYTKLEKYEGSVEDKFRCLWDYHIKGVLLEYLRGTRGVEEKMVALKKAFDSYNS